MARCAQASAGATRGLRLLNAHHMCASQRASSARGFDEDVVAGQGQVFVPDATAKEVVLCLTRTCPPLSGLRMTSSATALPHERCHTSNGHGDTVACGTAGSIARCSCAQLQCGTCDCPLGQSLGRGGLPPRSSSPLRVHQRLVYTVNHTVKPVPRSSGQEPGASMRTTWHRGTCSFRRPPPGQQCSGPAAATGPPWTTANRLATSRMRRAGRR